MGGKNRWPAWTPVTPVVDGWTGKPCGWFVGVSFYGCPAPPWLYPKDTACPAT